MTPVNWSIVGYKSFATYTIRLTAPARRNSNLRNRVARDVANFTKDRIRGGGSLGDSSYGKTKVAFEMRKT